MVPVVVWALTHQTCTSSICLRSLLYLWPPSARCGPPSQRSSQVSSLNDASEPADHLSTSVDPVGADEHLLVKARRSQFRGLDQLLALAWLARRQPAELRLHSPAVSVHRWARGGVGPGLDLPTLLQMDWNAQTFQSSWLRLQQRSQTSVTRSVTLGRLGSVFCAQIGCKVVRDPSAASAGSRWPRQRLRRRSPVPFTPQMLL